MKRKARRSRHRFESIPNIAFAGQSQIAPRQLGTSVSLGEPPTHNLSLTEHGPGESRHEVDLAAIRTGAPSANVNVVQTDEAHSDAFASDGENLAYDHDANLTVIDASNHPRDLFRPPIMNWRVLWALSMTVASRRLTKEQYQSVRLLSAALVREGYGDWKQVSQDGTGNLEVAIGGIMSHLPHYSTLYKTIKPYLFRSLTVRSIDHTEIVNLRKAGAKSRKVSDNGDPVISVRTVLPSEYAREDFGTRHVFDAMYSTSLAYNLDEGIASYTPGISADSLNCVDTLPLVAARDWFYGPPTSISIDKCEVQSEPTYFAEVGDVLRISLISRNDPKESFARCFASGTTASGSTLVKAMVIGVWAVEHPCRYGLQDGHDENRFSLSERDREIRELFDSVTYTSPSDLVPVPEPEVLERDDEEESEALGQDIATTLSRATGLKEARRRRRAAMDARKRVMHEAWRSWEKPIVKPGDVIALLRPCCGDIAACRTMLTSIDKQSRILLVYRYWTEEEERNTHMLWVPGGSDLERIPETQQKCAADLHQYCEPTLMSSACKYVHTKEVVLESVHSGPRGPHAFTPVSSFGTLNTGERYGVYRFILFWDGFEVQDGKEATGDGIYLLCLNLPTTSSRTPNDVRVLSLTPPGVKTDTVIREIVKDIVKGMTEGFEDVDAQGQLRRIFLDLVGFVGDTPALNGFLDTLGHNACACCHLCRYVRKSSTIVGSRFTGRPAEGTRTAFQRGFYQQRAVRDCNPGPETCRLLGMKHNPKSSSLILHDVRAQVYEQRTKIPKTSHEAPVVPCALDPYKACFVAPDHLLTGHARDCINLSIKLLPTREVREMFEGLMLGMLSESGLPAQTRLVNQDNKKLHGMTMTELYGVCLLAPIALSKAIASSCMGSTTSILRDKCSASVSLVASVSRLINKIWFKPDIRHDRTQDVVNFGAHNGTSHLIYIRELVDEHIGFVEEICAIGDNNTLDLEDSTCSRDRRTDLTREKALCVLAKKAVDKPNVHRLRELVLTTLPMLGHVSIFGELALEKTHQQLKRAIRISNKKDAHLQAMDSAIFGDWQGRLTLSASPSLPDNTQALLPAFRLLRGRESVLALNGSLSEQQTRLVNECMHQCVLQELKTQGKSVLSLKMILSSAASLWTLGDASDITLPSSPTELSDNREAECLVKRFVTDRWGGCTLWKSNSISCTVAAGMGSRTFSKGDIIETLTVETQNSSSNYPFVMQRSGRTCTRDIRNYTATIWSVNSAFEIKDSLGKDHFFVALRPCIQVRDHESSSTWKTYRVDTIGKLSIAKLDSSVRHVPALHDCDPSQCIPQLSRSTIRQFPNSATSTAPFIALTRSAGFPPRQG